MLGTGNWLFYCVYPMNYIIHAVDYSIHVPAGDHSIIAYRKTVGEVRSAGETLDMHNEFFGVELEDGAVFVYGASPHD